MVLFEQDLHSRTDAAWKYLKSMACLRTFSKYQRFLVDRQACLDANMFAIFQSENFQKVGATVGSP